MSQNHFLLEPRGNPAILSLVIPIYNEQEVIGILRERLTSFARTLPCAVEFVLVNDGSRDRSIELLVDWARQDPRAKVVGLARNFGQQAAVTAGLDTARGEAVVIMDADLQDPPEVVHAMLAEYRKGYDVVYGQRATRANETRFKRLTSWGFYRVMRRFIHKDLPADTGDFRLVSRKCLDAVMSMRETHRFMRGIIAWVGFPQTAVKFDRPPRAAGETKYPLSKMIRLTWTAATSFSTAPLRLSLAIGFGTALFGLAAGLWAIWVHFFGHTERGWTSLMAVICIVGGAILCSIGVLGEYIGRIFEEVKGRPLYIVGTRVNLADHDVATVGPASIHLRPPLNPRPFAEPRPVMSKAG